MLKIKNQTTEVNNSTMAVKLLTGDEIIGHLIQNDSSSNEIVISNPLLMIMAEDHSNPTKTRVMFAPWMIAGNMEDVHINKSHVVTIVPARDEAAKQYEQAIK